MSSSHRHSKVKTSTSSGGTSILKDILHAIGVPLPVIAALRSGMSGHALTGSIFSAVVLGLIRKPLQALVTQWVTYVYEAMFPTANILAEDPAFDWILAHLAQDTSVRASLGAFRLATADRQEAARKSTSTSFTPSYRQHGFEKQLIGSEASFVFDGVVARILPFNDRWIRLNHMGQVLWIRRTDGRFAGTKSGTQDHLEIATLFFQRDTLRKFLSSVHKAFFAKRAGELHVYTQGVYRGQWGPPVSRPARPWEAVILPPGQKEALLADAQDFLSESGKQWYRERGIPHRRGYLFHGTPGAGKTSLVTALATRLKLDIYMINPSTRSMDDEGLNILFCSCPSGSLIVIEDIDCCMPVNRTTVDGYELTDADIQSEVKKGKGYLTLSGLLNAIDGVTSQEDCILIASTNHPDRLDHALIRPGRFDVKVEFDWVVPEQARDLFLHLYPPSSFVKSSATLPNPLDDEKSLISPGWDERQFLAQRFCDALACPPKLKDHTTVKISMAALQGYFMKYKMDPVEACDGIHAWLESLTGRQDKQLTLAKAVKAQEAAALEREKKAALEKKSNALKPSKTIRA